MVCSRDMCSGSSGYITWSLDTGTMELVSVTSCWGWPVITASGGWLMLIPSPSTSLTHSFMIRLLLQSYSSPHSGHGRFDMQYWIDLNCFLLVSNFTRDMTLTKLNGISLPERRTFPWHVQCCLLCECSEWWWWGDGLQWCQLETSHTITLSLPCHTVTQIISSLASHWSPVIWSPRLAGAHQLTRRWWVLNRVRLGCHLYIVFSVTARIHQPHAGACQQPGCIYYLNILLWQMRVEITGSLPWDMIQWFRCDEDTLLWIKLTPSLPV